MAQQKNQVKKDEAHIQHVKAVKDTNRPTLENTQLAKPLTDDDQAVISLRCLLYDICNQHGGGHGGSAIGMAAIGVALWKYTMRYNPLNSEWFDRDRFVLSNGKYLSSL